MHALLAWTLLASIDPSAARGAQAELQAMCDRDRGRLWGRSVCGPIVFAEHGTREAVQIADGVATPARVPDSIGIGEYHQRVARNVDVDVLQVVLACSTHAHETVCFFSH